MLGGFPTRDAAFEDTMAKASNSSLQNLAGNMFPGTVISAFLTATIFALNAPSSNQVPDDAGSSSTKRSRDDDNADLLQAMTLLKKAKH